MSAAKKIGQRPPALSLEDATGLRGRVASTEFWPIKKKIEIGDDFPDLFGDDVHDLVKRCLFHVGQNFYIDFVVFVTLPCFIIGKSK